MKEIHKKNLMKCATEYMKNYPSIHFTDECCTFLDGQQGGTKAGWLLTHYRLKRGENGVICEVIL